MNADSFAGPDDPGVPRAVLPAAPRPSWQEVQAFLGAMDRATLAVAAAIASLTIAIVAVPFFAATTFIGDDHLFLAFARYAPNPLVAFVRDQHGGEFYRPLPMLVWWVVARLAPGSTAPFAGLAFALHAVVAIEVGVLVLAVRGERRLAGIAALLFFVSPFTREAAYWYSASTDLFATAFALASVHAILRRRLVLSLGLLAAACWSKETVVIVPPLAAVALVARDPRIRPREIARRVVPLWSIVVAYLGARSLVLCRLGGSGDQAAPLAGKLLQIGAGLVHATTSSQTLGEGPAWALGLVAWALMLVGVARRTRRARPQAAAVLVLLAPLAPLAFIVVAVAPLLVAPWIVGARYFYLPAVGIAWLAAEALRRRPVPVPAVVGILCALAGLGLAQDLARRAEVGLYEAELGAARRAVVSGLADGFTTFHVAAGIKDLDLAVKEDPRVRPREASLLVLGDVPASFVAVPASRLGMMDFLVAHPPLPPSGAYHFGDHAIVGLARRGEDPTLDEVTARFPGIRFIRLRAGPGGRVIARDVTDERGDADADAD